MNIPGNAGSERAVLAGIVKYGKNCFVEFADVIDTNSFNDLKNQIIYKCLVKCLEISDYIDYPLMLSSASELGLYDAITQKDQTEYIKSLFNFPILEQNIIPHVLRLKNLELRRGLQEKITSLYNELETMNGDENIAEILSLAENCIFDYTTSLSSSDDSKPVKIFDGVYQHLEYTADNPVEIVGIPTGYSVYDRAIGGGQRAGSVNLIVARTGVGKTMHAKSICMSVAAKSQLPVLMIDSEMSKMDQVYRAIADATTTEINDIETGKFGKMRNRDKIFDFVRENKEIPYFHKSTPLMCFEDLAAMIRRWILVEVGLDEDGNRKPCLVVYDYFKVMNQKDSEGRKEFELLGHQMSFISQVCNKYGASCTAYVQANRDGITDEDLSIIAQSDRLSWFASSVCLLKEKTMEEIAADSMVGLLGNAKMIILKSRFGPKFLGDFIDMNKQGQYGRITELGLASEIKQKFQSNDIETEDIDEAAPWED